MTISFRGANLTVAVLLRQQINHRTIDSPKTKTRLDRVAGKVTECTLKLRLANEGGGGRGGGGEGDGGGVPLNKLEAQQQQRFLWLQDKFFHLHCLH